MSLLAHARIVMWEGGSLWVADAVAPPELAYTEPHAHHAIQISFSLGGRLRLRAGDLDLTGEAIVVAPDTLHVFEAVGLQGHLFVDPESRDGRIITRLFLRDAALAIMPPGHLAQFAGALLLSFEAETRDAAALVAIGRSMISDLTGGVLGDAPDLRVRKLIAAAAARLDQPTGLSDFAGSGGLSISRLRHLFVEQTGLAFRTYLLWLRLSRALEILASGAPVTIAAHEAGFSDSAHLSRTFKRMFGISPTALRIS